jgi:hypothetical protein
MPSDWTRRSLLGASVATALGVAGCLGSSPDGGDGAPEPLAITNARQYSSPGCGCCGEYASYLDQHVDASLEETVPNDVAAVKREHGIPRELQGCHTVVLDEYVVEGHVPVEAIATLLDETPDIDGIALPGMPAGSPGMGGQKSGPFTVYALGGGRTGEVYVEI